MQKYLNYVTVYTFVNVNIYQDLLIFNNYARYRYNIIYDFDDLLVVFNPHPEYFVPLTV